jgi:hypothetical protein
MSQKHAKMSQKHAFFPVLAPHKSGVPTPNRICLPIQKRNQLVDSLKKNMRTTRLSPPCPRLCCVPRRAVATLWTTPAAAPGRGRKMTPSLGIARSRVCESPFFLFYFCNFSLCKEERVPSKKPKKNAAPRASHHLFAPCHPLPPLTQAHHHRCYRATISTPTRAPSPRRSSRGGGERRVLLGGWMCAKTHKTECQKKQRKY